VGQLLIEGDHEVELVILIQGIDLEDPLGPLGRRLFGFVAEASDPDLDQQAEPVVVARHMC
jgi:hypothetical protein